MANEIKRRLVRDAAKRGPRRLTDMDKKLIEMVRVDVAIDDQFNRPLLVGAHDAVDGTPYTGAAAEVVVVDTGKSRLEIYQAAVATPAVVVPYRSADGLELRPVAAADALELSAGILSGDDVALTVGMQEIMFEAVLKIDDISDVTEIFAGIRKAEAYSADPDDYDEMAAFNIGKDADGQVEIHTILNNAATAEVDTTEADVADGETHTIKIIVRENGKCEFFWDGDVPTVTASFSFDVGEVVVPFIHLNTEVGDPGVTVTSLKFGHL